METDTRKLKQRRAHIKGQVTRIQQYFETTQDISVEEAQVRLQKLEELFGRFEEIQSLIDDKADISEDSTNEAGEIERGLFEEGYYRAAAKARQIIEQHGRGQQASSERPIEPRDDTSEMIRRRPTLPEIKLPKFNGDYTKWLFFKDSFETTIHADSSLTAMQKH